MGVLDRFRSGPPAEAADAAEPVLWDRVSHSNAARQGTSAPVTRDSSGAQPVPSIRQGGARQGRARQYAQTIGFIGQTYRFMAHQAARCPWQVEISDDGTEWAPLAKSTPDGAEVEAVQDPSADVAWEILDLIQPERGSQGDLARQMVYLDDTVGEFYVIEVVGGDGLPRYLIRDSALCSPKKRKTRDGPWVIQDVEGGSLRDGTAREVPARAMIGRHWQDDPNSPLAPTSSLIGLVDDVDTYFAERRHLQRELRSRIAMHRVMWTPSEAHEQKVTVNGEEMSKLSWEWAQSVARTINDMDDAMVESIAPFLLNTPGNLSQIPKMIDVGNLGADLLSHFQDARQVVASTLPLSSSFILDAQEDTKNNHWDGWLADDRDDEVIRERFQRCLNTMTERLYRPSLYAAKSAGAFKYDPQLVRIGYNSEVIRRQLDNSDNTKWAYGQGLIGPATTRYQLHLKESDKPTEAELAEMLQLADMFRVTRRALEAGTSTDQASLPSADDAVPNGGRLALLAAGTVIDDRYLLDEQ